MNRLRALLEHGRRRLKRIRSRATRRALALDSSSHFIPLQAINRTLFEYEIEWYGEHYIYEPQPQQQQHSRDFKLLSLNNTPQALARPYYFHVRDAILSGGQVIDPTNPSRIFVELLANAVPAREGEVWHHSGTRRRRLVQRIGDARKRHGSAFIFSTGPWDNYYHFVVDCALRYVELENSGAIRDATLMLHGEPNAWQSEYLQLLQIGRERTIMLPDAGEAPLCVSELIITSPQRARFVCSGKALARYRRRMLAAAGVPDTRPERRIYISRRAAGRRRLLNEADVIGLVESRGFETLILEDMPVREQIRIFAEAHTIVAPHGAGLTNLVYAERPRVIEFIPVERWNFGFFIALVNSVGGIHIPIVSGRTSAGEYLRTDADDADFSVNIEDLRKLI